MTSAADRLLATGMPIAVAGGEERLRFTLLAIKRCEDAYGTLAGTLEELQWVATQLALGFPEPVAGRLSELLQHVLGHPAPVDAESTPAECAEALLEAWFEAFPAQSDAPGKA